MIWVNFKEPNVVPGSSKGKDPDAEISQPQADVAIAWCRNRCNPDPVMRIWASGELIFTGEDIPLVVETNSYDITSFGTTDEINKTGTVDNFYCEVKFNKTLRRSQEWAYLHITVTPGSQNEANMDMIPFGSMVTLTGTGSNDGTYILNDWAFLILGNYALGLLKCAIAYDDNVDRCNPINPAACVPFVDESGGTITLTVIAPGGISQYFSNHTGYNGDPTTDNLLADPTIVSVEGAGNVSAHRGTTYSVINNLNLAKWAGILPKFEAEIRERVFRTVQEVIEAIIERSEALSDFEYDTTALAGSEFVVGYITIGPQAPTELLRGIMDTYDVIAQQQMYFVGEVPRSQLVFMPRTAVEFIDVPYSETSARESGNAGDVHALITRGSKRDLPQEFILEFISSDRDLQPGTTSYTISTASVRNTRKANVPIVFDARSADTKARELLWRAIYEHDEFSCKLMPSQFAILSGDRLRFTDTSAGTIQVRVIDVTVGENGILDVRGRIDDELAYDQGYGGNEPDPDIVIPTIPQNVSVKTIDMAPMTASDAERFGLYFYVFGGDAANFSTTAIYVSLDQAEWTLLTSFNSPAIAGQALTVLPEVDEHFWDPDSTVDVRLHSEAVLTDEGEEQVASGLNWAWLGGEVIAFTTATLLQGRDYRLSGLLRGRNDTAPNTAGHSIGESFVVLGPTGPQVLFREIPATFYQVPIYLRPVPAGTTIADNEINQVQAEPNAETLRPYSVHGIWATRILTEDVCLFVTDRSRVPFRLFSPLEVPQVEVGDAEDFVAEVYWDSDPGPGLTWELVRELTGCRLENGQISFHYTRAFQVEDFHNTGRITDGSFPFQYRFIVYRKSDTIGPGRQREFCTVGYGFIPTSDCNAP